MKRIALVLVSLVVFSATAARAQEEIAPEELREEILEKKAAEEEVPKDGWKYSANIGLTGSFAHSRSVVGAVDGVTVQLGALLNGAVSFVSGQHEWSSTLNITHTQSLTPAVDVFVKSADSLVLESIYSFRFGAVPWLGPFVRFRFTTAIFPSNDVRAQELTVVRTNRDGSQNSELVPAEEPISLTGPFEPLIFFESAGLFLNPVEEEAITIKTKLGIGGQHIVVRDGFSVNDNEDTPELELKQLEDSNQGGIELEIVLNGIIQENVTWGARANFFYPFVTDAATEFSGIDALNTELGANISIKLGKWASLDYVFSAKHVPLLVDDWQIQNGLVLTAGFNLL